jgi:hypothetical protein
MGGSMSNEEPTSSEEQYEYALTDGYGTILPADSLELAKDTASKSLKNWKVVRRRVSEWEDM